MCLSTKSFTENSWKSKALDRTLKIKSLSKRIKELTASRDLLNGAFPEVYLCPMFM